MTPSRVAAALLLLAPMPAAADRVVAIGAAEELVPAMRAAGLDVIVADQALRETPPTVRAGGIDEARTLGAEGLVAFGEARFADAVARLERALDSFVAAGLAGVSLEELSRLSLTLGLAREVGGDTPRAEAAITLALRLRPDLVLDPAQYGPPARRTVERLRAAAAAAPLHDVHIETEPAGAALEVDGVARPSSTEGTSALAEGPHLLRAAMRGRLPVAVRVEVAASSPAVRLELPVDPRTEALSAALRAPNPVRAARRACEVLRVSAVLAARRQEVGWNAALVDCDGAVRHAVAVRPEAVAYVFASAAPIRSTPTPAPTHREESRGGVPLWAWVTGAGLLVAAGVVVGVLAAQTDEPDRWILDVETTAR